MKYFRTYLLTLKTEFISKFNIIGWILVSVIPTIVLVWVWFSILGERNNLDGYTKGDFLIYYIFTTIGWYIVGGTFGLALGKSIKEGKINTSLLKPYNIAFGQFMKEQAWKTLSLVISIPIVIVVLFLFRDIVQVDLSFTQFGLLVLSLILGAFNFALIEALIGLRAFWVVEIWPLSQIKDIFLSLFGGLYVPLSLLPPIIYQLANILPFKYMFYVPVSILLGKSENPLLDIAIQGIYILILFGFYKLAWNTGIKRYEAIGV